MLNAKIRKYKNLPHILPIRRTLFKRQKVQLSFANMKRLKTQQSWHLLLKLTGIKSFCWEPTNFSPGTQQRQRPTEHAALCRLWTVSSYRQISFSFTFMAHERPCYFGPIESDGRSLRRGKAFVLYIHVGLWTPRVIRLLPSYESRINRQILDFCFKKMDAKSLHHDHKFRSVPENITQH